MVPCLSFPSASASVGLNEWLSYLLVTVSLKAVLSNGKGDGGMGGRLLQGIIWRFGPAAQEKQGVASPKLGSLTHWSPDDAYVEKSPEDKPDGIGEDATNYWWWCQPQLEGNQSLAQHVLAETSVFKQTEDFSVTSVVSALLLLSIWTYWALHIRIG